MMKCDYLIIGQGLAGSILAYQLLKKGKTVAIIDERKSSTSSRVAAGLANPFTGPKMVKTWKADHLFPFLQTFYREIENEINASFFSERTIYRPFTSIAELNDWDGRSVQSNYQKFIKNICAKEAHSKYVYDPLGGVEIHGFVLNVPKFLDTMHPYFLERCNYQEERFDEANLELTDGGIKYHDIRAGKIIFCSGHQILNSKFFGWIPITPVKGEVLHLKMNLDFETIYNKSCFIIPQMNGYFKAGSTYNRSDLSNEPTEKGKNEIIKKLEALMKMKYEIVKHEAGIRPGTVTRKPLIGFHPAHQQLAIFNGLGSKGVSIAPFFSDQLVKCLEDGNNLDEEVDIKKYYSLYFKSQFSTIN